ncbi:hypothetical protein [Dorea longicatena]|uniref:hypothetical protein n=1 Tax=Dorea longicatena TaxID=88431 RepID=UPI00156E5E9A|nr:hypothetical protein [Dorea longicatena]NSE39335.1 hypothetical protein [Dorea longicatena]
MFSNLNAEMGRAKLSIKSLSELTGINYETLKLKFRGVTEFKLCEMVEIKRKAFPDKTLDYLFATDDEMPKAHLSVKKIADGYAECDVRLTAGHKK